MRAIRIQNYVERLPLERNRVTTSDRIDIFGCRLPKIDWSVSDSEKQTVRALHAALDQTIPIAWPHPAPSGPEPRPQNQPSTKGK